MTANGTAVEVVYVTSAANRPVICPVRPWHSPGSKLVWRNICRQGARGLLCYRGTSSLLIDDSNVSEFCILSRLLCKYCDKQITTTDRVSKRIICKAFCMQNQ